MFPSVPASEPDLILAATAARGGKGPEERGASGRRAEGTVGSCRHLLAVVLPAVPGFSPDTELPSHWGWDWEWGQWAHPMPRVSLWLLEARGGPQGA